ncbi:MAG TPA: homoserine dehydrogenase [Salinivirga sp.]|uniref:homoserine dehydrogenase n=1 Tax=Salinivirga sp. TaxID=1970192 RepID=UPI002B478ED6|nr:homoserine dehydrogenase [Salinivirga sp.]HKK59177.1 homoserine dehydrogenase [Salinivirga sp.]
MKHKKLKIGILGFGTVGQSLYEVLQKSPSTSAVIEKVVARNPNKKRNIEIKNLSFDTREITESTEIDTVVELINDDIEAFKILKTAFKNGKNVVSGNKKMIAENLQEIIELQNKTGQSILYDASACGSIPVIRNLEEYYDNDLLQNITGILNGSSNYILTQMYRHNKSYNEALTEAQEKGFAEHDPVFDVDGFDAMYKLIILTLHGFGTIVKPKDVFFTGISGISESDIRFAREKGLKIKLIAHACKVPGNKVALFVMPAFVEPKNYLYNVDDEFNGVIIEGDAYDKQLMFGKGAGGHPTGSAVLSDISALSHQYKYEYKKLHLPKPPGVSDDILLKLYFRYEKPETIDILPLQTIEEQYIGPAFHYTVGTVKLADLLINSENLRKFVSFMALRNISNESIITHYTNKKHYRQKLTPVN